jgi:hypothetical protein
MSAFGPQGRITAARQDVGNEGKPDACGARTAALDPQPTLQAVN